MEPISSSTIASIALTAVRGGAGRVSLRRSARKDADAERLIRTVMAETDSHVIPILVELKGNASEAEQSRIAKFLHTPGFQEYSRAVAIAVVATEVERFRDDLISNLGSLLTLTAGIPTTRSRELAQRLTAILVRQLSAYVNKIRELSPKQAELLVDRAAQERQAGYLRSLAARTSLLDETGRADAKASLDFSLRYRESLHRRSSMIAPAHFDTQRRVPLDALYVIPELCADSPEAFSQSPERGTLSLSHVLTRGYRAVVLGQPGAGKSTLAQKIAYELSADAWQPLAAPIPFVVQLRKYEERKLDKHYSVIDYIEAQMREEYQITVPSGALNLLLITGRGFVVFDGMDELLQTHRRREMVTAIESFAHLYASTPIVVTSREVGYRDAPLSDSFKIVTLLPFPPASVEEYVRKWFALDESLTEASREYITSAFLRESETVPDLRTNALMLSLLCNVYRGVGSIPQNRADLYEQCATMLFERWDSSRGIITVGPLKSDVRAALHDIALWAFTDPEIIDKIPEGKLVRRLRDFWLSTRYEGFEQATEAAIELLALWRGRAWVLTDVGTTPRGERLYKFTHQTFLEYFAGVQLVRVNPTPVRLWKVLAEPLKRGEWDIVAQIAIQIMEQYHSGSCNRLYELLLREAMREQGRSQFNLVSFAARHVESLMPSPAAYRSVVRAAIELALVGQPSFAAPEDLTEFEYMLDPPPDDDESTDEEETEPHAELIPEEAMAPLLNLLAVGGNNVTYALDELETHLMSIVSNGQNMRQVACGFVFLSNLDALAPLISSLYGEGVGESLDLVSRRDEALRKLVGIQGFDEEFAKWSAENLWAPLTGGRLGLIPISKVVELTDAPEMLLWTDVPILNRRIQDARSPLAEALLVRYLLSPTDTTPELLADAEAALEKAGRRLVDLRFNVFQGIRMSFTSLCNQIVKPYFPHQRGSAKFVEVERGVRMKAAMPQFTNPYAAFAAAVLLAAVVEYEEWQLIDQSDDQVAFLHLGPLQPLESVFVSRRVNGFESLAKEAIESSNLPEPGRSTLAAWSLRKGHLVV